MAASKKTKNGMIHEPSLPPPVLPIPDKTKARRKHKKIIDPNMSNPRLLVNRPCIYERKLPGGAYITAHVQRLQHGFYSSPVVSDTDCEHVDFLGVSFVFHSSQTSNHRFKSATIRAAIYGDPKIPDFKDNTNGYPPGNPRFLMHAPHLIFGAVSPETMQWTFSLAGSLGISEAPVSASVIPSGSVNKQFRRYEMMHIQGSSRTLKSPAGPEYDVEAGEIVWSLEENNLQRSGLPREFTFVMLIDKPAANSKVNLRLDIDPVLTTWYGNYPNLMLSLSTFQPLVRRSVDFNKEIGQRFTPADGGSRFNFAALESSFDEYIAMPGRKFTRTVEIPPEPQMPQNNMPQSYPGQYGNNSQYGNGQYGNIGQYNLLNPVTEMENEGFSFRDNITGNLLMAQLRQLQASGQGTSTTNATTASNNNGTGNNNTPMAYNTIGPSGTTHTLNVRLFIENGNTVQYPTHHSPTHVRNTNTNFAHQYFPDDPTRNRSHSSHSGFTALTLDDDSNETEGWLSRYRMDDHTRALMVRGKVHEEEEAVKSPPQKSQPRRSSFERDSQSRVMTLANVPLTHNLLASVRENAHF
ncbi:hypothetical protein N7478_005401 [Penicillium angulare]|uniref:uncharacterized protein n=1 Tax=Penicillium angulare TaxID=116970 RepID=UPI00253FCA1D|nr:uncharacterized protein N7478_005401 [Penicillium angulare]KAJ5280029.1 hypothetical protein N7478_005401 [Penicillium angulare]